MDRRRWARRLSWLLFLIATLTVSNVYAVEDYLVSRQEIALADLF